MTGAYNWQSTSTVPSSQHHAVCFLSPSQSILLRPYSSLQTGLSTSLAPNMAEKSDEKNKNFPNCFSSFVCFFESRRKEVWVGWFHWQTSTLPSARASSRSGFLSPSPGMRPYSSLQLATHVFSPNMAEKSGRKNKIS